MRSLTCYVLARCAGHEPGRARAVGQDAEFAEIARAAPGFGGMFLDADGRLNVYMTPSLQGSANARQNAFARIERALARRGRSLAEYEVVVLDGARDFLQLQEYHDRMLALLGVPGVVFTDIDEMNNRMRVGVLEGTDPARIDQAVAGTDDAEGSIEIEDTGRPMFNVAGAVPFPLAGEVLDKVGRSTGWTRGPVLRRGAGEAALLVQPDHVHAGCC